MKRPQIKRQKKRVTDLLNVWLEPLGLRWWRVDILWSGGRPPRHSKSHLVVGSVEVAWQYNRAVLTVYLRALRHLSDEELERWLVHELVHILVAEMREYGTRKDAWKHEERVVSRLTAALFWVRDYAKRADL